MMSVNRADAAVLLGFGSIVVGLVGTFLPSIHQLDQVDHVELRVAETLGVVVAIGGSIALSAVMNSDAPTVLGIGLAIAILGVYEWGWDRRHGELGIRDH